MARSTSNLEKHFRHSPSISKKIFAEMVKSPILGQLYCNKKALQYEATYVRFSNDKWYMNPQYFCRDEYRLQDYYPIILIVNNLASIYEFTPQNMPKGICRPKSTRIGAILQQMNSEVRL